MGSNGPSWERLGQARQHGGGASPVKEFQYSGRWQWLQELGALQGEVSQGPAWSPAVPLVHHGLDAEA